MNASNLLKTVLRPRALSAASRQRSVSEGTRERRSLSPDNRLPSSTLVSKKSPASAPVVKKTTCMCSPTNHPGSFRCRYHREMAAKSAAAAASIPRGRSPSPASPSFKRSQSEMLNSVVFSEVNRTLPGCASRTSRSPTGRTSRLQKMTMSTGFEEEDEIMCLIANDVLRSPKASPSIRGLPSSDGTRSSAFSFKAAAEIEIPTMFCQSTSTVATDIFSRSMSRMYL